MIRPILVFKFTPTFSGSKAAERGRVVVENFAPSSKGAHKSSKVLEIS
jgi:hypothetical protein